MLISTNLSKKGVSHFPQFDTFHSNCAMQVMYPSVDCDEVYDRIYELVNNVEPMPTMGIFEVQEYSKPDLYIWATRTSQKWQFIDDVLFEFVQTDQNC